MNIADRILSLRKVGGLSQEELADKIGVSRQAISKWESAQSLPEIDKIIALAALFEVTTDYILTGAEPKPAASAKTELKATIFVPVATALNVIGLILILAGALALWHLMVLVSGLICMIVGCTVFGVGLANSTQSMIKTKAKRSFWTINIWILSIIPLWFLYNVTALFIPISLDPFVSNSPLPIFGVVYLALGLGVIAALRPRQESDS